MPKSYTQYKQIFLTGRNVRLVILFFSFLILFSALAIVIISTYDQTRRQDEQYQILVQDVEKQKAKYESLIPVRDQAQSTYYVEKEARNVLGYSYPDEQLYIAKNPVETITPTPVSSENVTAKSTDKPQNDTSALHKWLDLIFG